MLNCYSSICWVLAGLAATAVTAEPTPNAAHLRGKVIDAERGNPVAGARIAIAHLESAYIYFANAGDINPIAERFGPDESSDPMSPHARTGRTDEQGNFYFDKLAAGEFGLVIGHPQKGVAVLSVVASPEDKISEVKLDKPTTVQGRLRNLKLDSTRNYVNIECESPMAWLTLSVRLNVDGEGRFDSGPLPAMGRWSLVEWEWELNNAYTGTVFKIPVDLKPHASTSMDIDVGHGRILRGKVVGPKGEPLSYAAVMARSSNRNGQERGAITGADGSFAIEGLSEGSYQLAVDRWRLRKTPGCGPGPRDIHLEQKVEIDAREPKPLKLSVGEFIPGVEIGDVAPEFTARTLGGRDLRLRDVRGKVVLMDFWASWCGMCQTALPTMMKLQKKYEKDGLVIVGVSVDTDAKKAQSFVARHAIPWSQTALGPIDSNPVARLYNVNSTPTIILIGRDGKVIGRDIAANDLEKSISEVLVPAGPKMGKSGNTSP
jgi:peroxiredoxin